MSFRKSSLSRFLTLNHFSGSEGLTFLGRCLEKTFLYCCGTVVNIS
jgi:hypothetical protein